MRFLKKLIKCFIPYGFIALRRKLIEKEPLFKKFMKIDKDIDKFLLCDTTIKTLENSSILQINRGDYKHPIYLRNHIDDVWIYREILDNHEYSFIVKNEPKYIIDGGANIGMASIYFANKYKDVKVIAVEPEAGNFEMLKRNVHGYTNITAINAALWNTSGEIAVFDTNLGNTGFMVETNISALRPITKKVKHLTKAITIDEIMQEFAIDSIDILKIDIEGAEKEVFESCKNWINKTKCVIIELHERMKKGCNKSLYKNVKVFDQIGKRGEDVYLSKNNYIKMDP
jgi:FkbM family methyltransferase